MVVRESLSADLIDRLICDIVAVTERLVASDAVDLAALQTHHVSAETRFKHERHTPQKHHKRHMKAMGQGIHRSVC